MHIYFTIRKSHADLRTQGIGIEVVTSEKPREAFLYEAHEQRCQRSATKKMDMQVYATLDVLLFGMDRTKRAHL